MDCSPDRLVADDGLLEIKAPLPHTQVEYWLSGEVGNASGRNCKASSTFSQRCGVDILCWHDVLPKLVVRVEPDEKFIAALDRELQMFNYFLERVMEKIRATTALPIPPGRSALTAALRASLDLVP